MAPVAPRPLKPCFMFLCFDGADASQLRARDLDGHLAHVEEHWDRYIIAGPTRTPGRDAFNGSLFLVYASNLDEAWELMRKDPYFTNGQYERVEALLFTPSIGLAIGGKTWDDANSIRHKAAGGSHLSSINTGT